LEFRFSATLDHLQPGNNKFVNRKGVERRQQRTTLWVTSLITETRGQSRVEGQTRPLKRTYSVLQQGSSTQLGSSSGVKQAFVFRTPVVVVLSKKESARSKQFSQPRLFEMVLAWRVSVVLVVNENSSLQIRKRKGKELTKSNKVNKEEDRESADDDWSSK
jgi:hypothetical protein